MGSKGEINGKLKEEKLSTDKCDHKNENWFRRCLMKEVNDWTSLNLWRAVFAEFLGTMMLCLWTIGGGLYDKEEGEAPPLLHGAIGAGFYIAVIIQALLNVSGGHVNPAISIGFFVTGNITLVRFILYSAAQSASSVVAVLIIKELAPVNMHGGLGFLQPGLDVTTGQALGGEFTITFLLLFGTFAIIDADRKDISGSVPLVVGLIVVTNILFMGNISGGCMNPARNFGPAVMTGKLAISWIYWVGPLLGGATGALIYDKILSVKAATETTICGRGEPRQGSGDDLMRAESVRMLDDMA